jgi:hypothetical protein
MAMAAKYAVTSLAGDQINRGKQVATADVNKVKEDTITALKQLQGSVLNSLTETETYALGKCLQQCQSQAKAMLAAYNASLQNADSNMVDSAPATGGNKKKRKTKNTHRKGNKKYSRTKKYRR